MQFCSVHLIGCVAANWWWRKERKTEETKKMVRSPNDCPALAVWRISWSDDGNQRGGPQSICKLCPGGCTTTSVSSRRCFAVNRPQSHSHAWRNTTCWAPCCNSSRFRNTPWKNYGAFLKREEWHINNDKLNVHQLMATMFHINCTPNATLDSALIYLVYTRTQRTF